MVKMDAMPFKVLSRHKKRTYWICQDPICFTEPKEADGNEF